MPPTKDAFARAVWGELIPDASGRISETERALSSVRGFATIGMVGVILFGAAASPDGFQQSLRGAATALIAAAGAFAVGAVLGFMFGLPRWNRSANPPAKPGAGAQTPPAASSIEPNSNLHRVVEWLTTLIVGLGLVHLPTAWEYGTKVSVWLSAEITSPGKPEAVTNGSAGAAILGAYAIAGFFMVFLWAQRYMADEMRASELGLQDLRKELEDEKAATKAQINSVIELSRQAASGTAQQNIAPAAAEPTPETVDGLAQRGVDASVVADLKRRYAGGTSYEYEPLAHFAPKEDPAKGRLMEAAVAALGTGLSVFEITLRVKSTDQAAKPLTGDVAFLFHHTLPPVVRIVASMNGVAEIRVQCIGTFCAGAIVLADQTRLAFDLATIPGVPPEFLAG